MSVNNKQNMEKTILEAAEKLFLEKGFAMVSTTQIAKVAGCNQALVHYYFRTKDRLFEAIFAEKLKTFFSVIFQPQDESLTFEEKLKKYIGAHFDILFSASLRTVLLT
jgi:AcrR family transcriptional regulator